MASVRSFGAVGDGIHDDTESIKRAVAEGDGTLEFDRGNYRITESIKISLNETGRFSIHGSGGTAKIIMDGPGAAFHFIGNHEGTASPLSFLPEVWEKERMPMVYNIEIVGNHPEADGITLEGIMQPTIYGVFIRETRCGILLTGRLRNVLIDCSHIYNNSGVGIWMKDLNLHQVNITGSHISYNKMGGIRVEQSEIRNLQITGNDIEYNNNKEGIPTAEIYVDVTEGSVREGSIASNTIQATYSKNGCNIRFKGKSDEDRVSIGNFSIVSNLIGTQEINVHLSSTHNVALTGNVIYGGFLRNVLIEKSGNIVLSSNAYDHPAYQRNYETAYKARGIEPCTGIKIDDCKNIIIESQIIQDTKPESYISSRKDREALLEVINSQRVTIASTQILDSFPAGIYIENCEETTVNATGVFDKRIPARMETPIIWKGSNPGNMISSCNMKPGISSAAQIDDAVAQNFNLF